MKALQVRNYIDRNSTMWPSSVIEEDNGATFIFEGWLLCGFTAGQIKIWAKALTT